MIMLRLKRYAFNLLRYVVSTIGLTQRLPMVVLYLLGLGVVLTLYKLFKAHRLLITYHRAIIRVFFALNGIRLKYEKTQFAKLSHAAIISNYFSGADLAILFVTLPYQKLQFVPPQFFGRPMFKALLTILGFYPQDTEFDVRNFRTKSFDADPYAKAGFLLVESVRVASQSHRPIPYALMLAIKHELAIIYLEMRGNENTKFATFWRPRTVELEIIDQGAVSRRMELTIMHYRRILERFQAYGKTRRYLRTSKVKQTDLPKMPAKEQAEDVTAETPTLQG